MLIIEWMENRRRFHTLSTQCSAAAAWRITVSNAFHDDRLGHCARLTPDIVARGPHPLPRAAAAARTPAL